MEIGYQTLKQDFPEMFFDAHIDCKRIFNNSGKIARKIVDKGYPKTWVMQISVGDVQGYELTLDFLEHVTKFTYTNNLFLREHLLYLAHINVLKTRLGDTIQ